MVILEKEAAEQLSVSPRTLQRWRREEGRGPSFVRLSRKRVGYPQEGLKAFVESRTFASLAAERAQASK